MPTGDPGKKLFYIHFRTIIRLENITFERPSHKSENLENPGVWNREAVPLQSIIIIRQLENIFCFRAFRIADWLTIQ